MGGTKKLFALIMATCAAITLSACGTVTEAATSSPGSQSAEPALELSLTEEDLDGIVEIPEVYVIQGATNVSFVKTIQYDESIVKTITADPSVFDSALEGSRSLKLTISVDQQAMSTKLGLENADDYTGLAEIQLTEHVKVVSTATATQILTSNPSAIILNSDNAIFRPEGEAGANFDTSTGNTETSQETEVNQENPGATTQPTDNNGTGGSTGGSSGNTHSSGGSSGGSGTNSGGSFGDSSGGGSTTQQPTHTHSWEPVYGTVHHDEVGHYETQTVSEAWDEPVYEGRCVCSACGYTTSAGGDAAVDDISIHILTQHGGAASYSVKSVQTGTIHHDAVTQQVWVVDQAAYDEQVITGYRCSCGATK